MQKDVSILQSGCYIEYTYSLLKRSIWTPCLCYGILYAVYALINSHSFLTEWCSEKKCKYCHINSSFTIRMPSDYKDAWLWPRVNRSSSLKDIGRADGPIMGVASLQRVDKAGMTTLGKNKLSERSMEE